MSDSLRLDPEDEGGDDFVSVLRKIERELHKEDIDSLKFLCLDFAPLSRLEHINSGHELINFLKKTGKLNEANKMVLAEMLKRIMRLDLVETLQVDEANLAKYLAMNGSHFLEYRILPLDLSNEIDKETSELFLTSKDIPESKRIKIQRALGHFLEQMNNIRSENDKYLEDSFKQISRSDLAQIITKYKHAIGVSTTSVVDQSENNSEVQLPMQPENPQQTQDSSSEPANQIQSVENTNADSGPDRYYKMDAKPRGICLIINNRNFHKDRVKPEAKKLLKREGTDVDAVKLKETFKKLQFSIQYRENLSDTDMVQTVNQLAFSDHSDYNCFVCCILSHGTEGAIYGSNGCLVKIRDLTAPFRAQSCPTLSGKPKLFFIQACQGKQRQPVCGTQINCDINMDAPQAETIPNEADFLLGLATEPGFVSYRSTSAGSWYITKLTETLDTYAERLDLVSLLTLVNDKVGEMRHEDNGQTFRQSPSLTYLLHKKILFK